MLLVISGGGGGRNLSNQSPLFGGGTPNGRMFCQLNRMPPAGLPLASTGHPGVMFHSPGGTGDGGT